MKRATTVALLAVLALMPACAGDAGTTDESAGAPGIPSEEVMPSEAAPPTTTPPPAPAASVGAEPLPTAADSAAALAEDVSPEWKMRTRQMEPFAGCMEKTRNAPESVRPTLVEACHRLPDAPRRP